MADSSPEVEIMNTVPAHIREMASAMHHQTAETALRLGEEPKKLLWRSYKQSIICKTVFINGKIGAVFGISGILLGEIGRPWLVMSDEVNDYPLKVAFVYRQELKKMQKMFPCLEEYVDASNTKAIRMLELVGFKVSKNEIPLGGAKLRRAERRVSQ